MANDYLEIKFYEGTFTVPMKWAQRVIPDYFGMSIEEFVGWYTADEGLMLWNEAKKSNIFTQQQDSADYKEMWNKLRAYLQAAQSAWELMGEDKQKETQVLKNIIEVMDTSEKRA